MDRTPIKRIALCGILATLAACGSGSSLLQTQNANTGGTEGTPGSGGTAAPRSASCGCGSDGNNVGNPNLPSAAEQAAWFTANANTLYRLVGMSVSVEAAEDGTYATQSAGKTVRAAIVPDQNPNLLVVRKGIINKAGGLNIPFPPVVPLPNDPNVETNTYTLYACVDSHDTGVCDGPSFVLPLGHDYQNTLNSNVVHFAFDTNGTLSPHAISGFIAHVSLDNLVVASSEQLADVAKYVHAEAPPHFFSVTQLTLPNGPELGNPGSGAQFIIQGVTRIIDTQTQQIVYSRFTNPPDFFSEVGGYSNSAQILQAGHSYSVETQSFRGEQGCRQDASQCTPECTFSLPNVQSDQLIITSVLICPNIY